MASFPLLSLFLLLLPLLASAGYEEFEMFEMEESLVYVRFLHASPNAPAVDVVSNTTLFSGLSFRALTNYTEELGGVYPISILVSGTNQTVLQFNLSLQASNVYTAALIGFAAQLTPVLLVDQAPISNLVLLRLSHFSPDAPAVTFMLTNTANNASTAQTLSFSQSSSFLNLTGGVYFFTAVANSTSGPYLLSSYVTLTTGGSYSFFVVGTAANLALVVDGGLFSPVTFAPSTTAPSGGLSSGAIAAIVICSIIGAAVVAAVAWYLFNKKRVQYETVP